MTEQDFNNVVQQTSIKAACIIVAFGIVIAFLKYYLKK